MELSIFWFLVVLLAVCLTPMLPFFGEQAVRLLRESWDGIIKADSSGNIKPHGAQLLADELFAMLDDNVPQTQNAPVTLNQQPNPDGTPGPVPLTINNPFGGRAIVTNGDIAIGEGGSLTVCKGGYLANEQLNLAQKQGGLGINVRQKLSLDKCPNGDTFRADGAGVTVTGDLNLNGGFYLWNGVPLHFGGGTTVFIGRVVSGAGDTYVVDLLGHGYLDDPTARVNVKIPQIATDEQLPEGFILPAVHKLTNRAGQTVYQSQPAVWVQ